MCDTACVNMTYMQQLSCVRVCDTHVSVMYTQLTCCNTILDVFRLQPAVIVEETVEELRGSPVSVPRAGADAAADDDDSKWDSDDNTAPAAGAVDTVAFITETPPAGVKATKEGSNPATKRPALVSQGSMLGGDDDDSDVEEESESTWERERKAQKVGESTWQRECKARKVSEGM